MEIKSCNYKTKCDMGGCKNLADFSVVRHEKSILNICKNCKDELYDVLGKITTPKSIPAPFKKQKKIDRMVK